MPHREGPKGKGGPRPSWRDCVNLPVFPGCQLSPRPPSAHRQCGERSGLEASNHISSLITQTQTLHLLNPSLQKSDERYMPCLLCFLPPTILAYCKRALHKHSGYNYHSPVDLPLTSAVHCSERFYECKYVGVGGM